MKKSSKIFCLLFVVFMLFTLSVTAFAGNETNDGNIKIQVTTNKGSYGATDVAEITATITNVSGEDINNVTAQAVFDDLAPAGKRKSQTSKSVDVLKSGESFSFKYKATLNEDKHKLNFFQKIILWFVRLFNGGYNADNNNMDVVAECVTEIEFGKFTAENVVQVGYEEKETETNDYSYEELIENVDIDEVYEHKENDVSVDEQTGIRYINNIIIIDFDWECSDERKAEIINSINGKVVGGVDGYNELHVKVETSTLEELEEIIKKLNENDDVDAEYDEIIDANFSGSAIIPNDPFDASGLESINWNDNSHSNNNWWILSTESHRAWGYEEYNSNINIGIIDSGFDVNHNDYNIEVVSKEKSSSNHGTHVTGIIGAKRNNEEGIAGITTNSRLYGYDVETSKEYKTSEALKGLEVLVEDYKCKVINFSGGYKTWIYNGKECITEEGDLLTTKISDERGKKASKRIGQLLKNKNVDDFIVVMAAGNGAENTKLGIDAKNSGYFAAITEGNCYNKKISKKEIMDRVIIVANSNQKIQDKYTLWMSSNGGGSQIDIAAPGTNIYSTLAGIYEEDDNGDVIVKSGQQYGDMTGTSMAAPIVAGVAGLVWSVNKDFTGSMVKNIIIDSAERGGILVKDNPTSPTTGDFYLVNAKLAVEKAMTLTYDTCTVKGSFVDDNDYALTGVNIIATNKETGKRIYGLNNNDGTYSLLLTTGTYNIEFSKYATKMIVDTEKLTNGQVLDLGEDWLFVGNSIVSGTSIDSETKKPISDVSIRLVYNDNDTGEYDLSLKTDEKGSFLKEIRRGNYYLVFEHPDYDSKEIKIDISQSETDLGNIELAPKGSGDDDNGNDQEEEREITASGECGANGNNVTYTLYEDGELVISGSGEMADYPDDLYAPWYYARSEIETVLINNGITRIGSYSFFKCDSMQSIYLPNTIKRISQGAFMKCTSIADIIIPDDVEIIEYGAFANCESLINIVIPQKVTYIDDVVFSGCKSLVSIQIPDSVTYIGEQAFCNCTSLSSVIGANCVEEIGNSVLMNATGYYENTKNWNDGVLYLGSAIVDADDSITNSVEVKKGTLCVGSYAFDDSNFEGVTLPNGLKRIEWRAFYNSKVKFVEIPNSVSVIYGNAFESCTLLTNISFPDNVQMVGEIKFGGCNKLESVILPDGITSIDYNTFRYCFNLKNITLPNTVKSIGNDAFYQCSSLESIVIPNGVTSIGDSAFEMCRVLSKITIPDSVTFIGNEAFEDCNNLTNVYYSGTQEQWDKITIKDDNDCLLNATIHYNA